MQPRQKKREGVGYRLRKGENRAMWILFAFGSALFAGLTSILAKCGIRKTDSTVATAIRTIVVLAFSWLMVFVVGSQGTIGDISGRTLLFWCCPAWPPAAAGYAISGRCSWAT